MHIKQPKKLLIINILDILRKYTDENHRLSQKDIVDILRNEYGMNADRKAIKRNLMNLIDFGYEIEYSEAIRMVPNPKTGELEESYMLSDFYLIREFTDGELRLLIDSLLFSKHIPYSQCKELIEKLEGLSNKYFQSRVRHIRTIPDYAPKNKQLFFTIEVLDEAISHSRQVSFTYNEYGLDRKLHPRLDSKGNPRKYIINPYQIAATNGRYYLICNYDKYDNLANYRLDRITDIKLLSTPRKPIRQIKGLENGFDLPKHMAEHIYMFAGESKYVRFRSKRYLASEIIDWFGTDAEFSEITDDEMIVTINVNEKAMFFWSMQYGEHIDVIEPLGLRERLRTAALALSDKYK